MHKPCNQIHISSNLNQSWIDHVWFLRHSIQTFHTFGQCTVSFFITLVLVNFNLGTCMIKHGQKVKGFGLVVKSDDVFHDVGIVPPIQGLEIVTSQDINFSLSWYIGKENNFFSVPRFQKRFHGLQPISRLGPFFGGQVVIALLISHFGDFVQDSGLFVVGKTVKCV